MAFNALALVGEIPDAIVAIEAITSNVDTLETQAISVVSKFEQLEAEVISQASDAGKNIWSELKAEFSDLANSFKDTVTSVKGLVSQVTTAVAAAPGDVTSNTSGTDTSADSKVHPALTTNPANLPNPANQPNEPAKS